MTSRPFLTAGLASTTYSAIYIGTRCSSLRSQDARVHLRAISGGHAIVTTLVALYTLSQPWQLDLESPTAETTVKTSFLDDSTNVMIHGRSSLGNGITSWEFGYLIYDTVALLSMQRKDPTMLAHHFGLLAALGYLQVYIARGRERGIWIIVTLMLMNASNPLLHLRWWRRRIIGRYSVSIDGLFATVFATCRFGVVAYVLHKYGNFHDIGALNAFSRQRLICQLGTVSLTAVNAFWLSTFLLSFHRRHLA